MGSKRSVSIALSFVLALAVAASPGSNSQAETDRLIARGYDLTYNLDFADALHTFEQAAAANPSDAEAQRGIATCTWLSILYNRGSVTVDDYIGRIGSGDVNLPAAPAAEAARFKSALDRALALGEQAVRRNPKSATAHYDVGSAVGLMASYVATVEGRTIGALRAARRAYNEQEQALALDPRRKDAGLIVGTYRYVVASLPLPLRMMAYIVGFGGGRERGIQMIEQAAAHPGESQVEAKFALLLLYNRERRFDQALTVIRELQARFPRNRLLWLEAGATALRAGRPAEAEKELTVGLDALTHDRRPRSFGEDALWHYKRGAARRALGNRIGAQTDLERAASLEGRTWVTGRAHLDLGRLADLAGDRTRARREYQAAARLGEQSRDPATAAEATRLLATPYRKEDR